MPRPCSGPRCPLYLRAIRSYSRFVSIKTAAFIAPGAARQRREATIATMQDVARAAGVSMMTVSNVINGRPHVRGATREKVLKAIGELDYRVNVAARSLRAGRTGTIGLAVPSLDRPYFGQLAARLVEERRVGKECRSRWSPYH